MCSAPAPSCSGAPFPWDLVAGHGGFGITYLGTDIRLRRPVAIKEFFPVGCARHGLAVRPSGGWQDSTYKEGRKRFLLEGESLARFDYSGIVRVYVAFEENETAYIVMEYLRGRNLEQVLHERGGRLDEADALRYVIQVGEALEVVHEAGLLHHDVKPANIMVVNPVSPFGAPRSVLVDFGAAREFAAGVSQNQSVMLTPGYAPLEALLATGPTGRFTDVYSLAAVMYHLLAGTPPPGATDRALGDDVPDLAAMDPAVSPQVARAVLHGLEMDAKRRPQSVLEFLELLHKPSPAGPASRPAVPAEAVPSSPQPLQEAPPPSPSAPSHVGEAQPKPTMRENVPAVAAPTVTPPQPPRSEPTVSGLRPLGLNAQGYQEFENARDGTLLILVPAVDFTLGSRDGVTDEMPPHPVSLESYLLGKYEITNSQFRRFVSMTGYDAMGNWEKAAEDWGEQAPVVCISWYDALAYCRWAGVRLPTEAEWEFAARGPTGGMWPWGDDWDPGCLVWDKNSDSRAHPVGSRPVGASPIGALDMAGNVWEWCSSKYKPYPYRLDDKREDPRGADGRVVRGGSWSISVPGSFRCSYRYWACPVNHSNGWGFRVAKTREAQEP